MINIPLSIGACVIGILLSNICQIFNPFNTTLHMYSQTDNFLAVFHFFSAELSFSLETSVHLQSPLLQQNHLVC